MNYSILLVYIDFGEVYFHPCYFHQVVIDRRLIRRSKLLQTWPICRSELRRSSAFDRPCVTLFNCRNALDLVLVSTGFQSKANQPMKKKGKKRGC